MVRVRFRVAPEVRIWLDWKHTLIKSESERDEKLKNLAATKLTKVQSKYREHGYLDTSAIVSCGWSVKTWLRSDEIRTFLMPMRPLMWYETLGTIYVHTALRVKLAEWCQACWAQRLGGWKEMERHYGHYLKPLLRDKERHMEWIKEYDERRQQQQQEAASNTSSQSDSKDEETVQSFACSLSTGGQAQRQKRKLVSLSAPSPYAVRILHCSLCDKGNT